MTDVLIIDHIIKFLRGVEARPMLVAIHPSGSAAPLLCYILEVDAVHPGVPSTDYEIRYQDVLGSRHMVMLSQLDAVHYYNADGSILVPNASEWREKIGET